MLRAMKEYYEANPVTETTICAGMVGVPMLDPEIDTVLYLTDACTEVELFQDSNHQKRASLARIAICPRSRHSAAPPIHITT